MAARAVTPTELAYLRRDNQWSELFLAIHQPATVFTARLGTPPASTDLVAQISYNTGSGSGALAGQTVCIGTSAGAWDKGQVRLRNTPTLGATGTLDIGETSEVDWTAGDYLTIIDEFGLWARQVRVVSDVTYMDYDIAYSNQHANPAPVPVMGSPVVLWLTGASVSIGFDASESWVLGGASITYVWTAPGAIATSGLTTATPTIAYNAAGTYRVACAVTANGVTTTGYRVVFVFDAAHPPITQFTPGSISGDETGWNFDLTLYAEAALPTVRDRALVVLFARDHYGADTVSIGPLAGRENIIAWGWVTGESLEWNAEQSSVRFTVGGPAAWLAKINAFPTGQENTNSAPTAWTQFQDLTVDKALWHALYWRSTLPQCADFSLTGDTKLTQDVSVPAASLWEQVSSIAQAWLLAKPRADRYGHVWIQVDSPYIPLASRASIPTVMTLTGADWRDTASIQRAPTPSVSLLDMSGVYFDGNTPTALFALAHGHVFKRWGNVERVERLTLADQAQLTELAGLYLEDRNNEYPSANVSLAANNRFFDIAPNQYAGLTLAASSTPRGATYSGLWWVRRVSYAWQPESGALLAQVELKAETGAGLAVTGDQPATVPEPPEEPTPVPSPTNTGVGTVYCATISKIGRTRGFTATAPVWEDVTGAIDTAVYGDITDFVLDPYRPRTCAWCSTRFSLWRTTSLDATVPAWTLMAVPADFGAGVEEIWRISSSIAADGAYLLGLRGTARPYTAVTDNHGADWTVEAFGYNYDGQAFGPQALDYSNTSTGAWVAGARVNYSGGVPGFNSCVAKIRKTGGATGYYRFGADIWPIDLLIPYWVTVGTPNSDSSIIYCVITDSVHKSLDKGVSWSDITPTGWTALGSAYQFPGHIEGDDELLFVTDGDSLWRSTDGGGNWTKLQDAALNGAQAVGLWPDRSTVFMNQDTGPYLSTDGGATFASKLGNWASVLGAFSGPVQLVPIW